MEMEASGRFDCKNCISIAQENARLHKLIQDITKQLNSFQNSNQSSPDSISSAIYFLENIDNILVVNNFKSKSEMTTTSTWVSSSSSSVNQDKDLMPPPGSRMKRSYSSRSSPVSPSSSTNGDLTSGSTRRVPFKRPTVKKEFTFPIGAQDCLKGLNFVISGTMSGHMSQKNLVTAIQFHGGHVMSAVTSETKLVIAGEHPGLVVIETARQLEVPVVSPQDLLNLIKNSAQQQK